MPAEVIPLIRVKVLERGELPARLRPVDKAPPKTNDMRMSRPPSRLAGRETDGVAALAAYKLSHRVKRAPKMRLFRSFKLFTGMKRQPGTVAPAVAGIRARSKVSKFR